MALPIRHLLHKLATQEKSFEGSKFIAPALGGPIAVRISGVVHKLCVEPPFTGWGIFQKEGPLARFVRPAGLTEIQKYLSELPIVRFILIFPEKGEWLGLQAAKQSNINAEGLVPIRLPEDGRFQFDTVICRFDGKNFYYQIEDYKTNLALEHYLRESLAARTPADKIKMPGLTPEQKDAYRIVLNKAIEDDIPDTEKRLRYALAIGGGKLESYVERARDKNIVVTFGYSDARGKWHTATSTVRTKDLGAVTAGICLSGTDAKYDLTSLVSIYREARRVRRPDL